MSRRTPALLTSGLALCVAAGLAAALPAPAGAAARPGSHAQVGTAPATLTIVSNAPALRAGQVLTLTGQLSSAGVAKPGARVLLLGRTGGTSAENQITTLTTDAEGRLRYAFHPRLSTAYRFAFVGDDTTAAVRSASTVSRVVPLVLAAADRHSAGTGDPVVVTGGLSPRIPAAAVSLQRRIGSGAWAVVATGRTTSTGTFSIRWAAGAEGAQALRVGIRANAAYEGASSAPVALTVAGNLRQGASGPRVLALQRRLAGLGYELGSADGSFGGNTLHALTAFQKGQRLPRTGVYDVATRERLAAPRALTVRYPAAGRAVEVDLSRQILIMSEGGRITWVVDISSGNNRYYYSDGVRYLAYTPTGRFHIQRKIDGLRVARLGTLYQPAYFTGGYAVHGSPSVPTHAASHGCVRVAIAQQKRLFPLLRVGTPVAIYAK